MAQPVPKRTIDFEYEPQAAVKPEHEDRATSEKEREPIENSDLAEGKKCRPQRKKKRSGLIQWNSPDDVRQCNSKDERKQAAGGGEDSAPKQPPSRARHPVAKRDGNTTEHQQPKGD